MHNTITSFFNSVLASALANILSYYICKQLDKMK